MIHGFLDTEIFRRENLIFDAAHFQRLLELVTEGVLSVYLTDFVVGEVKSAIEKSFDEAYERLIDGDLRRTLAFVGLSHPLLKAKRHSQEVEEIVSRRLRDFDDLLVNLKARVVPTDNVRAEELRRRYFDLIPPFGARKDKRHEFPDAISLLSLESWSEDHGHDIYVVSGDKGLREAAALTSRLKPMERLANLIEAALAHKEGERKARAAMQAIEALLEKIQEEISQAFCAMAFSVDELESEVQDVVVDTVEVVGSFFVALDGARATIEVDADVSFSADVTYADPDQTAYDSESGGYLVFGYREVGVHRETTVKSQVVLELDVEHPDLSSVEEVSIDEDLIYISLESVS
jgi:hypothetical protein